MLSQEILNENHHLDIPQKTIDDEIATLVKRIESKRGFQTNLTFDPERHLIFDSEVYKKTRKYSLKELGINKTHCPSLLDLAGTNPFPLFSDEAIDIMKWEIFHDPAIVKEFGRVTSYGKDTGLDIQMSGFAGKTSFIRQAWTHPKTREVLNEIAGINVRMPHVFSMSHINASLTPLNNNLSQTEEEMTKSRENQDANGDDIPSTLNWHYDSPPLVLVLMLSAPDDMVGGETAIRAGDESVYRIPSPKTGHATFLQGRVVKHIATKPISQCDRISYVVSFIPEDPEALDTSVCTSERPLAAGTYTNDKFYPNWVNYRFERIQLRMKAFQDRMMEGYRNGKKFDQSATIEFCKDIESYLNRTWQEFELVNDEQFPPKHFSIPYADL